MARAGCTSSWWMTTPRRCRWAMPRWRRRWPCPAVPPPPATEPRMAPWPRPAAAPPRPRARRGLTEAERALWQIYTSRAQVAPLPGKALTPPPLRARRAGARPAAAPRPARRGRAPPCRIAGWSCRSATPPPGLDSKRWKALRRGETRPERTLDLHGRRVQDAHGAVRRFLHDAAGAMASAASPSSPARARRGRRSGCCGGSCRIG